MKKHILSSIVLALVTTSAYADNWLDISANYSQIQIESNMDKLVINKITVNRGNCSGYSWENEVNSKLRPLEKKLAELTEEYEMYSEQYSELSQKVDFRDEYIAYKSRYNRDGLKSCEKRANDNSGMFMPCPEHTIDFLKREIEKEEKKAAKDYDNDSLEMKQIYKNRLLEDIHSRVESRQKEIRKVESQISQIRQPILGYGQTQAFSYSCGNGVLKEIEVELADGRKRVYTFSRRQ